MLGIKGAPELNLASVLTFSLEELPVTNSFRNIPTHTVKSCNL